MRRKKGLVSAIILLVCFMAMSITTFAKTDTQDGLKVTLLTDKQEYEADEQVKLSIQITNENDFDMYHISIAALIPDTLEIKEGADQEIEVLKAGESYGAVYKVQLRSGVKAETSTVKTSDNSSTIVWSTIFIIAGGLIIFAMHKFRRNKKFVKSLAVLLCLGITSTSLLSVYASDVNKSLTVVEKIKIDSKEYELGIKAGYVIDDDHDHDDQDSNTDDNHDNGNNNGTNPETPNHEHDYVIIETINPDCTESGWIIKECIECGETVKTEIPATGHTLGEWVTIKEATYTEEGIEVNYCTVCGEIAETRVIPVVVHDHDYETIEKIDPTCTEPGKIVEQCSICGTTKETEIPALGHVAGEWVTVKEATYTESGLRVQYCTICNEILAEEEIPVEPHEHNYIVESIIDPTCTQEGKKVEVCTICGGTKTTILPATGHKLGEWTIEKAPTCTETGLRVQRCTVCNEIINSEEIDKIEHNYIEVSNTATCTASGISYQVCVECGVEREVPVPALGHDIEATLINEVTCVSTGLIRHMCTRCNRGELEIIPATGHNWVTSNNSDGSWNEYCDNEYCTEQHNNIRTYTVNIGNGETAEVTGYFNREMSSEAYQLLNDYRVANNRNALSTYSDLDNWADIRALESAYKYSNAHTRPNGEEYYTVFENSNITGYGENLSSGSSTAQTLIAGWKESPDHNNNMLRLTYNYVGVSVFTKRIENENGKITFHNFGVQLFNSIY